MPDAASLKSRAACIELSIALSDNERTRPLTLGQVQPQGARLLPTIVHPSEMFWRQLKYEDFDVSEMSLSSLVIATARGDRRWVALPVYTSRRFFHTRILVRADRGIQGPADLKGKRVGVPEYQQTAALWSRGVLQHEFGVEPRDIEWYMERGLDKSHGGATGFQPPLGVRVNVIPGASDIGTLLAGGELDATLLYLNNRNLVDRSRLDLGRMQAVRTLFPDPQAEGRRYFAKTGIYPINHTVVLKRELYERHPWLALNLYHAFVEAKQQVEAGLAEALEPYLETGLIDASARAGLGTDPKPYGMKASRTVIDTLCRYVHEQGLSERLVTAEELFAASTMEI